MAFAQTAVGFSVSEAVFLGDFAALTTTNVTTQGLLSFNAFPSVIVNPVVSADGRSVAFSTHNRIAPEDTNSFVDVYRFDHDFSGYSFWLSKLEEFHGNFVAAEMVKAFITSDEYRHRFGQ